MQPDRQTWEQYVALHREESLADAQGWLALVEAVRRLITTFPLALKRDAKDRAYDLNGQSVRPESTEHPPEFWRGRAEQMMDSPAVWLEAMVEERDELRNEWQEHLSELDAEQPENPEQENDVEDSHGSTF